MSSRRQSEETAAAHQVEEVVLTRLQRLNAIVNGVVVGVLVGLTIFIATNWLVLKDGPSAGPHLALLGQFFPGYRVTFWGSLVGFAYGFACGFLGGYVFARIYNAVATRRERPGRRARSPAGDGAPSRRRPAG